MKTFLTYLSRRYIAGEHRADAIDVARKLNTHGILATIDNLGENVMDEAEAEGTVMEYVELLKDIHHSGVRATISIKLTHLGLDISDTLAMKNAEAIVKKAGEYGNFVRFDMESSQYTQRIIDIFLTLHEHYPNMGIAIQSYLYRSGKDISMLIQKGASIRLVKGAYMEPPDVAFPDKVDVDRNFEVLMKELLLEGRDPAIATHDERLIDEAKRFVEEKGLRRDGFEFQFLLGIKRSLQRSLAKEGYRVRVYIPYGENWLPYVMRRFRERKENLLFVLKNVFE